MKTLIGTMFWLALADAAPVGAVVATKSGPVATTAKAAATPATTLLQHVAGDPATLLTLTLGFGIALLITRSRRQLPTATV